MDTLEELEAWLEEHCYNFDFLSIGRHYGQEGEIFKYEDGWYVHSYSERGSQRVIERFATEKELVSYAYELLLKDKWSKAHIIAFVYDEKKIRKAESQLNERGITFERNDIPNYRKGVTAYRIFVFGRDILKCDDLKNDYMKY